MKLTREQVIEIVSNIGGIYSEIEFFYKLTHTHSSNTPIYLKAKIEPLIMEVLIAFIQYMACEYINHNYACDERNIGSVLCQLYGGEIVKSENHMQAYYTIDVHEMWEWMCGKYDEILAINVLKHDDLIPVLKRIEPAWI